jgi:hypothetical protein
MKLEKKIINFARDGKSFLTSQGLKLVEESDVQDLRNASAHPEVMEGLLSAANNAKDPYFKRKIFQALG